MNQKGISDVYALRGGTQSWKSSGFPMESSSSTDTPQAAPTQPPSAESTKSTPTAAPSPVRTGPPLDANGLRTPAKP